MTGPRRTSRTSDGAARREHRRLARAKLAELRAKLRDALRAKQVRMREIVAECRAQRIAVRTQIREMRTEALREIRERAQRERTEARDACLARKRQARQDFDSAIAVARAELAAEKRRQAEERRITRDERARHAAVTRAHATGAAHHVVRAPLLGPLAPLAARVREIAPGESRAEAVLRYAETHPDEAHAAMHPSAERVIAETQARVAEVERAIDAPTAAELERAARSTRRRGATTDKAVAPADPEALRGAIWDAHAAVRRADKTRQRRLAQFEKGDGQRSYQELRDALVAADENLATKSNTARAAEDAFRVATGRDWGEGAGNAPEAGLTRPAVGAASSEVSPAAGIGESGPPGASPRALNPYEAKQVARIARMRKKADRLAAAAAARHATARAIVDAIPMGQPILVGHHSERRHRRDLAKMDHNVRSGFELEKQAARLRQRADGAEKSDAISSDDPEAIPKLRAKLEQLEAKREEWRAANAAIRAGANVMETLARVGMRENGAVELARTVGRRGIPGYVFRNFDSESKRIRQRIERLEERAAAPAKPAVAIGDARIFEAANRVRVEFPSIPAEAIRRALKGAGFRWAPSIGAWQRHASTGAWEAARRILGGA